MFPTETGFSMTHLCLVTNLTGVLTKHFWSTDGDKPRIVVELKRTDEGTTLTFRFAKEEHARRASKLFIQGKGRRTDLVVGKANGKWRFLFTVSDDVDVLLLDMTRDPHHKFLSLTRQTRKHYVH